MSLHLALGIVISGNVMVSEVLISVMSVVSQTQDIHRWFSDHHILLRLDWLETVMQYINDIIFDVCTFYLIQIFMSYFQINKKGMIQQV